MTPAELDVLLEEIADGRTEDTYLELKSVWWDLKVEKSQHEFLRDIAAMTNADGDQPRRILVGVAPGGAIQDSPLPEDEANLQQRLHAITPLPRVVFLPVRRSDGATVTVVSMEPPFDRPHVLKLGKEHFLYVRAGSSRITASRAQLDRWYGMQSAAAAAAYDERLQEDARLRRAEECEDCVHDVHFYLLELHRVARQQHGQSQPVAVAHHRWGPAASSVRQRLLRLHSLIASGEEELHELWGWLLTTIPDAVPPMLETHDSRLGAIGGVIAEIEERLPVLARRASLPDRLRDLGAPVPDEPPWLAAERKK